MNFVMWTIDKVPEAKESPINVDSIDMNYGITIDTDFNINNYNNNHKHTHTLDTSKQAYCSYTVYTTFIIDTQKTTEDHRFWPLSSIPCLVNATRSPNSLHSSHSIPFEHHSLSFTLIQTLSNTHKHTQTLSNTHTHTLASHPMKEGRERWGAINEPHSFQPH